MSVMTVGFAPPFLESFQKLGVPVSVFVHSGKMDAGHGQPLVLNERIRFTYLEGGHDPELDIGVANAVRERALQVFFRTAIRAANSENAPPPAVSAQGNAPAIAAQTPSPATPNVSSIVKPSATQRCGRRCWMR